MEDLPGRPEPPRSPIERAQSWLRWIGVGRIITSAVVLMAVVAAAYWLVAPPAIASETGLPMAASSNAAASSAVVTASSPSAEVLVHVAGAVVAPGVYRLQHGARVIDAVDRAGGLQFDAAPDVVNLAAPISDGQRIYVPRLGEVVVEAVDGGSAPEPTVINLNSASSDELERLPGIGPATAAAIVAHRERHGPFATVDDLGDVSGIGDSKIAALRDLVTV